MDNSGLVLLVEDNPELNEINRRALTLEGLEVCTAVTIAQARALLRDKSPDVILLDVLLPDGDGMAFCYEVRQLTDAHILFLTARTEDEYRIKGLRCGGDDYIIKPYRLEEMLARVQAAMRRRNMEKESSLCVTKGELRLELSIQRALFANSDLLLTPKEFALLLFFVQNEGRRLTVQQIYQAVWYDQEEHNTRTVQVHISNLRKKLLSSKAFAVTIDIEERMYYRFILGTQSRGLE